MNKNVTKQFNSFEVIKGLVLLGIPTAHITQRCIASEMDQMILYISPYIFLFAVLGAPIFMICSGFKIGIQKNYKSLLKNGIFFLLIGLIYNIFIFFIPQLIEDVFLNKNIINDIDLCFYGVIYNFIGLFYIFYAILIKHKVSFIKILLITIILFVVNSFFEHYVNIDSNINIISPLLGNFVYVKDNSAFPLFAYLIFPCIGVLLKKILTNNKKDTSDYIFVIMIGISTGSFFLMSIFTKYILHQNILDYLMLNKDRLNVLGVLIIASLTLFFIGLIHFLYKISFLKPIYNFMQKISFNIIPYFTIHGLIYSYFFHILNIMGINLNFIGFIITCIIVTAATSFISIKWGPKIMRFLLKPLNKIINIKNK